MKFLVTILLSLLLAVAARAETVTSLTIASTPGDTIGLGQSYTRTPVDGVFNLQRNYLGLNGVSLFYHNSDYSEWWQIDFCGPNGAMLGPGEYPDAKRLNGPLNGHPGLQAWTNYRGCSEVAGSFTIKQIEYNPDGAVIRLWVTFVERCQGSSEYLSGEIRFNVDTSTPVNNATWGRVKQLYR